MLWILGFLLLLVALLIPILAIVLDSPALRRLVEARHGGGDSGIRELTSRVMALEDEIEEVHRAIEGMREETQFVQRLLENPERRDQSESSATSND